MAETRSDLTWLPSDASALTKRLLDEVGAKAADPSIGVEAAAKFSVGLLLPRFAGTMLKLLCEQGPLPGADLMERAALFQRAEPADRDIGFRLAVALDYLRRGGCVDVIDSKVQITQFGREVYDTRFRK
ncbi:MAG: hypothetical protein FJ291_32570 [Planctomycetes bacterium]|nr:hypothetical protein [Planctomycetota bacterium]